MAKVTWILIKILCCVVLSALLVAGENTNANSPRSAESVWDRQTAIQMIYQYYGDAIPSGQFELETYLENGWREKFAAAYSDIFSKTEVALSLCRLLGQNKINYQQFLGVQLSTATQLIGSCRSRYPTLDLHNVDHSLAKFLGQKRFYWIVTVDTESALPLWSWTKASQNAAWNHFMKVQLVFIGVGKRAVRMSPRTIGGIEWCAHARQSNL